MKLLLIEDSRRLRRSLQKGLEREGFSLDICGDGEEGFAMAEAYDYDVIILDLNLPGMDGLTVLRKLRGGGCQSHVLILSARDKTQDRIVGLDAGADDYLIKPFEFNELIARVRALIRREYKQKKPLVQIGSLEINTNTQKVFRADREIELTPKEFALLEYLLMLRGKVASRDLLVEHLYASYGQISSNVIDVVVCNLRKKLQTVGESEVVRTRRGAGYYISDTAFS